MSFFEKTDLVTHHHCNFKLLRMLSSSMSVEQFSEFDWNRESTLVTVLLELFFSFSFSFMRSGSQTGVMGVTGVSKGAGVFGTRLPLLTSSMALRSCE